MPRRSGWNGSKLLHCPFVFVTIEYTSNLSLYLPKNLMFNKILKKNILSIILNINQVLHQIPQKGKNYQLNYTHPSHMISQRIHVYKKIHVRNKIGPKLINIMFFSSNQNPNIHFGSCLITSTCSNFFKKIQYNSNT